MMSRNPRSRPEAVSVMDFPPTPSLSQPPSRYCSAAPALHLDRGEERLGILGGGGAAFFPGYSLSTQLVPLAPIALPMENGI